MAFHTLAFLLSFTFLANTFITPLAITLPESPTPRNTTVDIDSMDLVIFDIDQSITDGDFVEIPVFIISDDLIFTLDFSMLIDTANLEFVSIIDHTGELQYAAFLNPNDLKLRFTSNSFSPYPLNPQHVVSVRFKVESGVIFNSDFLMPVAYLNGEPCSVQCSGEQYILGSQDIITHETFISPNPATDFIYVNAEEEGLLNMCDVHGNNVIHNYSLQGSGTSAIPLKDFPRGIYIVSIRTHDHKLKTQKIVLQ